MTSEVGRRRRIRRALRRLVMGVAAVFVALLGLLSMGTAVGRYSAVPVDGYGSAMPKQSNELAVTVPVSTLRLNKNDIVAIPLDGRVTLYRIEGVDSWTRKVYAKDATGTAITLKTGARVSRVTHTVPHLGRPLRLMHGTLPGLILVAAGFGLMLKAVTQRRLFLGAWKVAPRRLRTSFARAIEKPSARAARRYVEVVALLKAEVFGTPAPIVTQRSLVRGKWWWTRLVAFVVAMMGVFSMTADAAFTATATVSQGAISTGVMSITVPAAGASNRLTLGATGLVPGDVLMRAVNVNVDSGTTSGIMTGMTLTAGSSTSGGSNGVTLADAGGIKVWVQSCSQAWTESGSTPAFSYTCGGTPAAVLGTGPVAPPAAGTCPSLTGTPSSLQTLAGATALNNMTLTANATNYLVIFMCLPTAMTDDYQNASNTITWTFTGTQRSAAVK